MLALFKAGGYFLKSSIKLGKLVSMTKFSKSGCRQEDALSDYLCLP